MENAKWKGWSELEDMPTMEAMRLYVRALEEDVVSWWLRVTDCNPTS